ncbi:hypothetical protein ACFE04_010585 [Oxalis oulophora]
MAASSRRSSSTSQNGTVFRSLSPSGRFSTSTFSTSFASSSSSCCSTSFFTQNHQRSVSPPRVKISPHSHSHSRTSSASVRFSLDNRPTSPNQRSISSYGHSHNHIKSSKINTTHKKTTTRTCMCSPTTHPGSFRCSLHKGLQHNSSSSSAVATAAPRMSAWRRSAMTNSLVRICGVEGDLVKRALAALIRPSSHQQRRRTSFQPRPSRLSVMSKSADLTTARRIANEIAAVYGGFELN